MIPERQSAIIAQLRSEATPRACRRFALTLLGGLPAAGLVWLLILRGTADRWIWSVPLGFLLAAVLLAGPALASPAWARQLFVGWHAVTRAIELALTWVLLALVFWLVITPVGLIRRRKSKGFHARPAPGAKSCWQEVPPVKDPARYYRQF